MTRMHANRWVAFVCLVFLGSLASMAEDQIGGVTPASARWWDRFLTHRSAFYGGNGFLGFGREANDRLSNDQADLMESLIVAYRSTTNRWWLEEFVRHATNIVARVEDLNGNGLAGWPSARYSENLVRNPRFLETEVKSRIPLLMMDLETPWGLDPTLPDGWQRLQGSDSTVFLGEDVGVGGSRGGVLKSDGTNWSTLSYAMEGVTNRGVYYFEIKVKLDRGGFFARLDARQQGTGYITRSRYKRVLPGEDGWSVEGILFSVLEGGTGPVHLDVYPVPLEKGVTIFVDQAEVGLASGDGPSAWSGLGDGFAGIEFDAGTGTVSLHAAGRSIETELWQVLSNPYVTNNGNVEPGVLYRVACDARLGAGSEEGGVEIVDRPAGMVLGHAEVKDRGWQRLSFQFRAPTGLPRGVAIRLWARGVDEGSEGVEFRAPQVRQFANHIVDDGLILNILLEFVREVRSDPGLEAEYSAPAWAFEQLADQLSRGWGGSWLESGDEVRGSGTYIVPDDGSQGIFARASLPLNQFSIAGMVHLQLYLLTGSEFHRERAVRLGRSMLRYLEDSGDGYEWKYYREVIPDGGRQIALIGSSPEDLAHANAEIAFMVALHRAGVVVDDERMGRLIRTVRGRMVDSSSGRVRFASSLKGIRGGITDQLPEVWWWMKLIELDSSLLQVFDEAIEPFEAIVTSAPVHSELGVWYDQGWRVLQKAMLAHYHKLSEARRLGPSIEVDRVPGGVRFSWPSWFENALLEGAESPGGSWQALAVASTVSGGRREYVDRGRLSSRFVRLRLP